MFYLYILKCADNFYYTGVTTDVNKRLWEHNQGLSEDAFTKSRRPVKLVYAEAFIDKWDAIRAEYQIKKWSRGKKEALINGDYLEIKKLAKG